MGDYHQQHRHHQEARRSSGFSRLLQGEQVNNMLSTLVLTLVLLLVSWVPGVTLQTTQYVRQTTRYMPGTTQPSVVKTTLNDHTLTLSTATTTAPTPSPTRIPVGEVTGNLTGENICYHPSIEYRASWKHITFSCDRRELLPCFHYPQFPRHNDTHCARTIAGECTANIYQNEPVTVHKSVCCDGYERRDNICIESVECQNNNGGCQHICRSNKEVGRHCECYAGFQLNGSVCADFDECSLQNGACSDICVNTIGSYYCKCTAGRQLASPLKCEDRNPCLNENEGSECDHLCIQTDKGRYYCDCRPGFKLIQGKECHDINECDLYKPCSFECKNYDGGYRCTCPTNQVLSTDNKTCIQLGVRSHGQEGAIDVDILKSPAMIGSLAALGALLLLVTCVWIICCYVRGICCCSEKDSGVTSRGGGRRRYKDKTSNDVDAIVVQYSNTNKKEESQNYANGGGSSSGFSNIAYENQLADEYNTHARTPNGLNAKEEMDGAIHIIPEFGRGGSSGNPSGQQQSARSDANGHYNKKQGSVALPGLT